MSSNNCNNKINTRKVHTRAFPTTAILNLSEGAWKKRKPAITKGYYQRFLEKVSFLRIPGSGMHADNFRTRAHFRLVYVTSREYYSCFMSVNNDKNLQSIS